MIRRSLFARCRRAAQPLPDTHPHLLAPGELTIGIKASEYAHRRDAFFASMPDNSVVVLPGAVRPTRTHDILWPFRQESNMWFLTGFEEPNSVAVFQKKKASNRFVMFCPEATAHSKLWDGPRAGTAGSVAIFGADEAFPRIAFADRISEMVSAAESVFHHNGIVPDVDTVMASARGVLLSPSPLLQGMRAVKSPAVQAMMQRTATISKMCFELGMGCTSPGRSEHHIHAVMDFAAQLRGAHRLAYVPVIASGRNALALHYIDNSSVLRDGDLVMVDGGAEYHYYPTDCSRTWPVSGTFSPPQRRLYDAVLNVQTKLLALVYAGQRVSVMQKVSEDLLLEEMLRIGVIPRNLCEAVQRDRLSKVYPHAWGHFMGIDIHERVAGDVFCEGQIHTVEPGVYIPTTAAYPVEYQGIGIRIEDNVIVGPRAGESVVTTGAIPRTAEAVEAAMREFGKGHPLNDFVEKMHRV